MMTFFGRWSRLLVPIAGVVLVTGALVAHRSHPAKPDAPVVLSVQRPRRAPAPRWRDQLALERAQAAGDRLVQRLDDGTEIAFTIDPVLQKQAAALLARYQVPYGALVLYELDSGKVRALAGHSQARPQLSATELCLTPWAPAASVFKLITASALLDRGVPPTTSVCYHGGHSGLRRHHIKDNPRIDRTCSTLSDAIARSINPVIAKLALRYLDRSRLQHFAERFGFDRAVPFELPVRPSRAEIPGERLELARTAAGFWHSELSPLHGAVLAGVAARDGLLVWPHIVERVQTPQGEPIDTEHATPVRVLGQEQAHALRRMMLRTTTAGTGRRGFSSRRGKPFLPTETVGGKTGSLSRRNPPVHYSWFVGFSTGDGHPPVAFAALLGNPARWRIKASTAARMLLDAYVHRQAELNRAETTAARERSADHVDG